MGQEQSQFIDVKQDNQHIQSTLCKLNENCTLEFGDEINYNTMNDSKFLKFLDKYAENKIKLIMVMGEQGIGKSSFMNFLIQQYYGDKECKMIFQKGNKSQTQTKGIQYYFREEPQNKDDEIVIFFDCQGFDYSSNKGDMNILRHLICLITRLSTCLFYMNVINRENEGFRQTLNLLNIENLQEDKYHDNFIEILNRYNGEANTSVLRDNYDFIKKEFFLHSYSFRNNKIVNNEDFQEYLNSVKQMSNYIKNSRYETSKESCKSFEKEQKCKSFKEILITIFQIVEKQLLDIPEIFLETIDKQLNLKQEFQQRMDDIKKSLQDDYQKEFKKINSEVGNSYISSIMYDLYNKSFQTKSSFEVETKFLKAQEIWNQNFKEAFKKMLDKGKMFNKEEKQQIIDKYMKLDSIKPNEMRLYEKFISSIRIQDEVNFGRYLFSVLLISSSGGVLIAADAMVASGIIVMIGLGTITLALSLAVLGGFGIYKVVKSLIQKKELQTLSEKLQRKLYSYISNNYIVRNNDDQNLAKIIEILSQEINQYKILIQNQQLNSEINCISFLLMANLISKPFDQKQLKDLQNKDSSFYKDMKILQIATNLAKRLAPNQMIDLLRVSSSEKIEIKDKDINIYNNLQCVEFSNQQLNEKYRRQFQDQQYNELLKCLFVLKNRNKHLLINFVCEIYFERYINSTGFYKKIFDGNLIIKTLNFQSKLKL